EQRRVDVGSQCGEGRVGAGLYRAGTATRRDRIAQYHLRISGLCDNRGRATPDARPVGLDRTIGVGGGLRVECALPDTQLAIDAVEAAVQRRVLAHPGVGSV